MGGTEVVFWSGTFSGWFISSPKRCTTYLFPSNSFRKICRMKLRLRWDNSRLPMKTLLTWDTLTQLWQSKWERNNVIYSISNTWAFITSEMLSWSSYLSSKDSTHWLIWYMDTSSCLWGQITAQVHLFGSLSSLFTQYSLQIWELSET